MGNPSPRLLFQDIELAEHRAIGKESKHLKLSLGSGRSKLDGIGFGMGMLAEGLQRGCKIDAVGELSVNEWNGQRRPQLQIHDLHYDAEKAVDFPEREHFGIIYQQLRRLSQAPLDGLVERLAKQNGFEAHIVKLMLEVFHELEFISIKDGMLIAAEAPQRRDLSTSERYRKAKQQAEGIQMTS
ncbi:hypothetical protein D3C80_1563360 [compost metagenome]